MAAPFSGSAHYADPLTRSCYTNKNDVISLVFAFTNGLAGLCAARVAMAEAEIALSRAASSALLLARRSFGESRARKDNSGDNGRADDELTHDRSPSK